MRNARVELGWMDQGCRCFFPPSSVLSPRRSRYQSSSVSIITRLSSDSSPVFAVAPSPPFRGTWSKRGEGEVSEEEDVWLWKRRSTIQSAPFYPNPREIERQTHHFPAHTFISFSCGSYAKQHRHNCSGKAGGSGVPERKYPLFSEYPQIQPQCYPFLIFLF